MQGPERLAVADLRAFEKLWREQKQRLVDLGSFAAFWERLARSWSIETGIIERVYDLSLGATQVLVERGFEVNLVHHSDTDTNPERLIEILRGHRAGLAMVMDLIGGTRKLTPAWIKELHVLLCRHQVSVTAREMTALGRLIEIPFEHGVYKKLPNNPTLVDGRVHEYCPPEHVASEVERLIEFYGAIPEQLPEVRSAWLHHAFTQVHPFQDGNGRVSRALASIDFIRASLFPLVVDRSDRDLRYIPALQHADRGDLALLVRFFADCQQRAIIQALSVAEETITQERGRKAVLEAARTKVVARSESGAKGRKEMEKRISKLADAARDAFKVLAKEVQSAVPGVKTRTERSDTENEHYWTKQIVEMAKRRGYWASTRESRAWARLQIEDGGLTDLVVVLHFVGNPSPGSCMSGMFLVHRGRSKEERKQMTLAEFTLLPQDPLVLVSEEDAAPQRDRFLRWLDEAVVVGLAEWKRQL